MVPVAQWLERVTVDDEVEGSTPFRHPNKKIPEGLFVYFFLVEERRFQLAKRVHQAVSYK